jgi:peptidoglycan/LPS O-acetylase OafA/YrhL
VLRDRVRARLPGAAWAPFVIGLIALYCYVHLMASPNIYWLGWAYCLVLAAAITLFRDSDHRVLGVISHRIATYSYGLYLLHVPALYVIYDLWGPRSLVLGLLGYVVLAAAAAAAAYHLLEAPMVSLGRRLSEPRPRSVRSIL